MQIDINGATQFICNDKSTDPPCRRIVPSEGQRCVFHSGTKTAPITPNATTPTNTTTYCLHCHEKNPPSDPEGRTPIANLLLTCASCEGKHHPSCIEIFDAVCIAKMQTYKWCCASCKVCTKCDEAGDEEHLVFCDGCDRGYHTYCTDPKLDILPEGIINSLSLFFIFIFCHFYESFLQHLNEGEYKLFFFVLLM